MYITKATKSFIFIFVSALLFGCTSTPTVGQSKLSADAFNKQIQATGNPQIIDVRTTDEYNSGHIANAQNLNIYDDDFNQKLDLLNKADTIFVYCKSGGRSSDAAKRLTAKGFKNVYELEGGMLRWESAKLPVEGPPAQKSEQGTGQFNLASYDSTVQSQPLVVVDFYAAWCGPCKMMSPYLEKLKATYPEDKLKIVKVDIDDNKELASHFNINSIPLIKFYNNGKEVSSQLGYISEDQMMAILKPYMK